MNDDHFLIVAFIITLMYIVLFAYCGCVSIILYSHSEEFDDDRNEIKQETIKLVKNVDERDTRSGRIPVV